MLGWSYELNVLLLECFQSVSLLSFQIWTWIEQAREHIRLVWKKEARICSLIWGLGEDNKRLGLPKRTSSGSSMFFLQTILVTPNRFRPPNMVDDEVSISFLGVDVDVF